MRFAEAAIAPENALIGSVRFGSVTLNLHARIEAREAPNADAARVERGGGVPYNPVTYMKFLAGS